jgi:iron complex outermembrane receptor protein
MMMPTKLRPGLVPTLLVVLMAWASPALAQQPWSLVGRVVDQSTGAPVPAARVHWVEGDRDVLANDDGRFVVLDIHHHRVTLLIEGLGYASGTWEVSADMAGELVEFPLTDEALRLEGIEVGVRQSAIDLRVPQSTSRLTPAEIVRERGQTLGETLEGIEGVSIIQYGPSIAKPVIRGLHSQRIVVMTDGVRQEGQQWGTEHAPEIDVFAVNEIQVIRGPGSVLYGSDALGGVLRIEPAEAPSASGFAGETVFNAFSNNRQFSGSAMIEHGSLDLPIFGVLGARARVSTRKSGDARTASYNLRNTGFTEFNIGLTVGAQRDWGGIEVDYSRFDTEIGLFTGAHVGNFDDLLRAVEDGPTLTDFAYSIDNPRQEVTHDAVRIDSHIHAGGAGTVETIYAFQLNRRREFDNHGPLAGQDRAAFGLDLYTHTLESRLQHEPIGVLEGTTGFSLMRQGNISNGKGFLIPQYRLYTGALFLSEEADLGWATLSGGARYEARWQRVFEVDDVSINVPDETRTYGDVAAAFGISVPLGDSWSIGATSGRAWRAPNVNERYSQGVHHGTAQYEIGDAELGKERTWSVDATLRHSGDRVSGQIAAYRNAISGYIYLEPRAPVLSIRGAYPGFEYAQTDAVVTGLEMSGEINLMGGVDFTFSGSLLRGTDHITDAPLYDMPADRGTMGLRFSLPEASWVARPFLSAGLTLVREQDRVPEGTIYALPTDGYQVVDLELGAQALEVNGRRINAGLEVRNLFDTSYRDYLSRYKLFVDDLGRDIVIRVRVPLGGAF